LWRRAAGAAQGAAHPTGTAVVTAIRYTPPGDRDTRRGRWVVLLAFWVAMALLCVGAVVVALVREPDQPRSQCAPPQECPGPPLGQPPSQFRRWASHGRGVSLVYPRRVFATESTSDTSLRLRVRASRPSGVEANLWLTVQRAGRTLPNELLEERKDDLGAFVLGITEDDDPLTIVPAPRLGDIDGVGGSYRGTADTPQGPSAPAILTLGAATNGRTTAVLSYVVTGTDDAREIAALRTYLSPILTSFTWHR